VVAEFKAVRFVGQSHTALDSKPHKTSKSLKNKPPETRRLVFFDIRLTYLLLLEVKPNKIEGHAQK